MEEDIFDQKIQLTDGTLRNVFSKECVDGILYFYCRVCRVAALPGINIFLIHVNGKKHKRNLSIWHAAEYFDLPFKSTEYGKHHFS